MQRRIAELREQRIEGLQTFQEFMERRLAPAMATCVATASSLKAASSRVACVTQLLSTKVNIALERQEPGRAGLDEPARRAAVALAADRQGRSVAAITYYITGLVGYAAKAVKAAGVHLDTDLVIGGSIPVIAAIVAFGLHRFRASVSKH